LLTLRFFRNASKLRMNPTLLPSVNESDWMTR
jgi:hypothetical protein